jgi:DNA (cytosine-5)-methyltransferase 1
MNTFYEFFAGGGMARLGLGSGWDCLFANDIDAKKGAAYRANFAGAPELKIADVATLTTEDLPGRPDLIWASFPCQDLSLAGLGAGLGGERSGVFWPFWRLAQALDLEGRRPSIIALENVCGTLTACGGRDFAAIADALTAANYRFGAIVLDAVNFVPQSRPRLFIVGVDEAIGLSDEIVSSSPEHHLHPASLLSAHAKLSSEAARNWIWWRLPVVTRSAARFSDLIEDDPADAPWHGPKEVRAILSMMSPLNLAKVKAAQQKKQRVAGTLYRRTRCNEKGEKTQRAEVRFDGIAGCLRTPSGGSSRQRILVVNRGQVQIRLLSSREAARLMGIPDNYKLPNNYNEAYHLVGDGVVVPVVRFLRDELFRALLDKGFRRDSLAA